MKIGIFFLLPLGFISFSSYSAEYPLEFADFFEPHSERVEIVIEGLHKSEYLTAMVSYDSFAISGVDVELFKQFLLRQDVEKNVADQIAKQLENGVAANPGCKRALSACIPNDIPGKAEFVFDYDEKLLRVFISSDMLVKRTGEKEFYNPMKAQGALVNWSNLYVYAEDEVQNINWINETQIGLPIGYLSFDSIYRYTGENHKFEFNRAIYNYELDSYRAILGYQDSNSISLNSTDFLNNGADYSGVSASFGSSSNLVKGKKGTQQRLIFFVPQGGQLEVYQGTRLLLSKVVGAGEQSIGYDELPNGTYVVTLRVKQGTSLVLEEHRQVVNSASFTLPVGEWDYRIDIGRLESDFNDAETNGGESHTVDNNAYARGLASYRPAERWLVGTGLVSNGQNTQWLLGSRVSLSNELNLQYTAGFMANGDVYQFGQINIGPLFVNARKFEHEDLKRPDDLSTLLYGSNEFNEYGVGISGSWLLGRTFANYYRFENKSNSAETTSDNLSLTWTHPLFGGDFSINSTYSLNDDGRDSWNTGLSWSRRFGESFQGDVGANFNNSELAYLYSDASYSYSGDDWDSTSRVGVRQYQSGDGSNKGSIISDASIAFNGRNDVVQYDAYGYVDTQGERSISGSISGTQLLSKDGASLTSKRGQAFVELAPKWDHISERKLDVDVSYQALKNGKYWYDETLNVGKNILIDLPIYSEVEFELDTESQNIDSDLKESNVFAMPGTYYRVNSEIVPLEAQMFILNDMNGEPVSHARCIGDGCKSVDTLSNDGVVRVNYRPNTTFKLISDKRLCVYNPDLIGERYIQAYCLPGLESLDGTLVREGQVPYISTGRDQEPLVYIGKYESSDDVESILVRLQDVGLVSKSISIGSAQYIYVQYHEAYTTAQRSLLESLDAYVILDSINTKQLFTAR
ncbi:TcfC E-set like domain-containing protein [Vibrio parahaemolyticus]